MPGARHPPTSQPGVCSCQRVAPVTSQRSVRTLAHMRAARAMIVTLVTYLPVVLGVHAAGDWLLDGGTTRGEVDAVTWLWIGFTFFMSVRAALMWARVRTDRWLVTGATR